MRGAPERAAVEQIYTRRLPFEKRLAVGWSALVQDPLDLLPGGLVPVLAPGFLPLPPREQRLQPLGALRSGFLQLLRLPVHALCLLYRIEPDGTLVLPVTEDGLHEGSAPRRRRCGKLFEQIPAHLVQ